MQRVILHARGIASFIYQHPAYELLPLDGEEGESEEQVLGRVYMVTMFRAKDERLNKVLKERINSTGKIYVSGTIWDGRSAVRCAVSNWRVKGERDGEGGWEVVEKVLDEVSRTCLKGVDA